MITEQQTEMLKKVLKKGYAAEVQIRLQEKGIKNKAGNEFDYRTISDVFNGRRENDDIETAIFDLFKEKKAVIDSRDELLKIEKPESGVSGLN